MSPHLQLVGSILYPILAKAGSSSSKPTSSGSPILLIIIVAFAAIYFFYMRPRSQRMKQAQSQARSAEVGDEVMLTSGIIGHVTWYEGNRARIEIAPGVEVQIDKAAILRKVTPPLSDDEIAANNEEIDAHLGDNPYEEPEAEEHPAGAAGGPPMVQPAPADETPDPSDDAAEGSSDEEGTKP